MVPNSDLLRLVVYRRSTSVCYSRAGEGGHRGKAYMLTTNRSLFYDTPGRANSKASQDLSTGRL